LADGIVDHDGVEDAIDHIQKRMTAMDKMLEMEAADDHIEEPAFSALRAYADDVLAAAKRLRGYFDE
jgi:hypothetical protein